MFDVFATRFAPKWMRCVDTLQLSNIYCIGKQSLPMLLIFDVHVQRCGPAYVKKNAARPQRANGLLEVLRASTTKLWMALSA